MTESQHIDASALNAVVDRAIATVGKRLVVVTPLGAGKPNHLINTFYARAKSDPSLQLTIATALTLEKPKPSSDLERRFLVPFAERVFGNYPDLTYELDRQAGNVPANIEIFEFYFPPGKYVNNPKAQQNYISSNYTHVVRDMMDRDANVLLQMVAKEEIDGVERYSLSCNGDVTGDMVTALRKDGRPHLVVGQVNDDLPFMYGDAIAADDMFDVIVDERDQYYRIFGPPKMSVSEQDFMIGLNASTLVKDDGELQVGIGSLGDAIIYGLVLREKENATYLSLLDSLGVESKWGDLKARIGGDTVFNKGLFGATEMMVDGYQSLYEAGILKKFVYDHIGLQRLLNEGVIKEQFESSIIDVLIERGLVSESLTLDDFNFLSYWGVLKEGLVYRDGLITSDDGVSCSVDLSDSDNCQQLKEKLLGARLRHGHLMHGGFFLGPQSFYQWLRDLPTAERRYFNMRSVQKINQLYGHEELDRLHRKNARFINTCMMTTLAGAHVSDGLADGRVVSGVGGQYNFVAMAQELPDGHSILMMRSTRVSHGQTVSNIVFNYGHITIPRHLRDIVVSEYGVANLRGKTDQEIAIALIKISDSRFQGDLLSQAKAAGKVNQDYQLPELYRQNLPSSYQSIMRPYQEKGLFNAFPFGSELTDIEKKVGKALKLLKADQGKGKWHMIKMILSALQAKRLDGDLPLLTRMDLHEPTGLKEKLYRQLLVGKFRQLGY